MSFTYIVDVKVSGGYGIMKKDYKVAVAGTGYVGLSIATLLSQHNNRKSPILDDYIEKI
jgi:UDPglucose 6-dehydrogenase